ncbi:hypothetical protein [Neobacillus niacini]|uniref:hypothetical protein n=1 Tax=Neobacillus niacini TaxID=86668 RepID=UPI0027D7EDD5|nr:hypothetical protein [Neobacillus niacini]
MTQLFETLVVNKQEDQFSVEIQKLTLHIYFFTPFRSGFDTLFIFPLFTNVLASDNI